MKIKNIIFILLFVLGCNSNEQTNQSTKTKNVKIREIIDCPECDGTGMVFYDENHPIVTIFGFDSGDYSCPMCEGGGKLENE